MADPTGFEPIASALEDEIGVHSKPRPSSPFKCLLP